MAVSTPALQERHFSVCVDEFQQDESLERLVRRTFQEGQYGELRHIACSAQEGCVTLSGLLGSYWLKQMAQTEVQRVPGVAMVRNQIVVSR